MSIVRCADIASLAVHCALENLSPELVLNGEDFDILLHYCDVLDTLKEDLGIQSFCVEVDPGDGAVVFSIGSKRVAIVNPKHPFFALVERSIDFGFRWVHEDLIMVELVFPSLWEER